MNSVNQLLALLPAGGWQRLMCDALWQSALIATLGWLVARFMMRQSAARAWVLLLTISACMIVPLASSVSRSMGWTVLASVERAAAEEGEKVRRAEGEILSQSVSHVTETPMISLVKTSSDESQIASSKIESKPSLTDNVTRPAVSPLLSSSPSPFLGLNSYQLLALIWLTASTLLVSRLLLSSLAVRRILRRAKPCDDAQILTAAVDAARRVGLKIAPAVLTSADIDSPMVLALGQPRLLVPQSTPHAPREDAAKQTFQSNQTSPQTSGANQRKNNVPPAADFTRSVKGTLGDANWLATFTHELAHVARHDGWSRLWVELIAIALPLQPLLWLARRSYYLACEEACDDWSVSAGSDPIDLAATLTAWLGRRNPIPTAAIGMSSSKSRVLRLLAMREKPSANVPHIFRWLSVPIVLLVAVGLAAAQVPTEDKNPTQSTEATAKSETDTKAGERLSIPADPESTDEFIKQKQEQLTQLEESLDAFIKASDAPQYDGNILRLREQVTELRKEIAARRNDLTKQARKERPNESGYQGPSIGVYTIEPPDILNIDFLRATPKEPTRIAPLDKLSIEVKRTVIGNEINETFPVTLSGDVVLGPAYGAVNLKGLTRNEAQKAIHKHVHGLLTKALRSATPPQVSLTIDESRITKGIVGKHLVAPDGTVNLGDYGLIYVAGMTVPEARAAIEKKLAESFDSPKVAVDVSAYNSRVYYVITESKAMGDNILRFPITGNETVLDAIANAGGISRFSSRNIWIARSKRNGKDDVLTVDWDEITREGNTATNYQVLPGDRIFVAGAHHYSVVLSPGGNPDGPEKALETVHRFSWTEDTDVLDAIKKIGKLSDFSQCTITIARRSQNDSKEWAYLAVRLNDIQKGDFDTNYKLAPLDRVIIDGIKGELRVPPDRFPQGFDTF